MNLLKLPVILSTAFMFAACGEITNHSNEQYTTEQRKNEPDLTEKNKKLIEQTTWYSNELGYSWNDTPNVIILIFLKDSVKFNLPGGDGMLASMLLGRPAYQSKRHSWKYSIDENEIVLDPGFTGVDVPLEISGDSLIWKGEIPPGNYDHISFTKKQPFFRAAKQ